MPAKKRKGTGLALDDDDVVAEDEKDKEKDKDKDIGKPRRGAVGCVSSSREAKHKGVTQPALKVAREVVHLVK